MTEGTVLRQVRLEALESVVGWHLRVVLSQHDEEGTSEEPYVLVTTTNLPDFDSSLDQAWVVMVLACHVLEDAGSAGRVASSTDSRPQT